MAARIINTAEFTIYPAIRKPKNVDAAKAAVRKVVGDWQARVLPKLQHIKGFQVPKDAEDAIRLTRSLPRPEDRELGLIMEKNLNAAREAARAKMQQAQDVLFPTALWKTVLPAEYVDAYKRYLDRRYQDLYDRSDALPLAKAWVDYFNDTLPKLEQEIDANLAEYNRLVPELEALQNRRRAFESGELTIEQLYAENPEIAQEIGDEIERGDWSVEGDGKEDEHEHGHAHH